MLAGCQRNQVLQNLTYVPHAARSKLQHQKYMERHMPDNGTLNTLGRAVKQLAGYLAKQDKFSS